MDNDKPGLFVTPQQLKDEAEDVANRLTGASAVISQNGVSVKCLVTSIRVAARAHLVALQIYMISTDAPEYGAVDDEKDGQIQNVREILQRIETLSQTTSITSATLNEETTGMIYELSRRGRRIAEDIIKGLK